MNETNRPELTSEHLERLDSMYNAVYDLCVTFTENEHLEWNMSYIGDITELVCSVLTQKGYRIRYPGVVNDERIEEFYSEKE